MLPDRVSYFRFSFRFFKKGSCQLLAQISRNSVLSGSDKPRMLFYLLKYEQEKFHAHLS